MTMAKEKLVLREGKEWLELLQVDPRGRLWLVTGGTAGVAGDIVRLARLQMFRFAGGPELSPFEAEVVVDTVTKAVLLPESGRPSWPQRRAKALIETLEAAELPAQARVVREWLGGAIGESKRNAA